METIIIIGCLFGCLGIILEEKSNQFQYKWIKENEKKYNLMQRLSLCCWVVCVILILAGAII